MSGNNTSMEIQLLCEMIQDREARMARIQSKADDLQQKSKRLASELEQVSQENTESSIVLTTERTQLMHTRQKAFDQLETTERDFQRQSMSLQSFAQVVAKQTSNQKDINNVDIAYVSKMQAQLCKAMHSMGILDHQMELCKQHAEAHIKAEKENLILVTEELSSVELNLMNDLVKMDTERRNVENDLTKQLEDVRKDIKAMQEQLGEGSDDEDSDEGSQKESDEEEEESEEEDEEEREIKEELMNVLQEKKDELRKLEIAIEEHEEQLIELEEHAEEMKAQAEDAAKRRAKKLEENGGVEPEARPVTPEPVQNEETADTAVRNNDIHSESSGNESANPEIPTGAQETRSAEDDDGGDAEALPPVDGSKQADGLTISDDADSEEVVDDVEKEETGACDDSGNAHDEETEIAQVVQDSEVAEDLASSVKHAMTEEEGNSAASEDVASNNQELVDEVEVGKDLAATHETGNSEAVAEELELSQSAPGNDQEKVEFTTNDRETDPAAAVEGSKTVSGMSVGDENIEKEVPNGDIGKEESTQSPSETEQTTPLRGYVQAEHSSEVEENVESISVKETEDDAETAMNDGPDVEEQQQ